MSDFSYPLAAVDKIVRHAKAEDDGTFAIASEFSGSMNPGVVVLVATTPERAEMLYGLYNAWYPES